MKTRLMKIAAILFLIGPAAAYADQIVYENPYDNQVSVAGMAWCSGCGTMWRVWDRFTLATDARITEVDARVYLAGANEVEFSVWTADISTLLFSQVIAVSDMHVDAFGGLMEADVTARINPLELAAGDYALSIWDRASNGSQFAWYSTSFKLSSTKATNGHSIQSFNSDGSGPYGLGTGEDMAFRVRAVVMVPEPGTLSLLGLGLLALVLSHRRRTRPAPIAI